MAGLQQTSTGRLRHDSSVASMERVGLSVDAERIVVAEWFPQEQGAEACRTLLDRCPTPGDRRGNALIAIGCYGGAGAEARGLRDGP